MAQVRRDSVVRSYVLVVLAVPAVLTAVTLGSLYAWHADLPQPIAIHWGASGNPNGFGSLATVAILSVVLGLAIPVFIAAMTLPMMTRGARGSNFRLMGAIAVGMSTLSAVLNTLSVGMQRGIADAHDGPSVLPALVGGLGAAIAVGLLAWFIQPQQAAPADRLEPGVPLSLADGERVVWMRTASVSRPIAVIFGSVVGAFFVAAVAVWTASDLAPALLILGTAAFLALVFASSSLFHVKVDDEGVTAVSALGFPRLRVSLDDVADASTTKVNGFAEFGGYGLRLAPGATGVILRNGDSLQVTRRNGKRLVITVDDAATAAALLTALAAKQPPAPQATPKLAG